MPFRIRHSLHRLILETPGFRCGNSIGIRLTPRNLRDQQRLAFRIRVTPSPARIRGGVDFGGNRSCRLRFAGSVNRVECHAETWIQPGPATSPLPALSPPWESVAALFSGTAAPRWTEIQQHLYASPWVRPSIRWADYARTSFIPGIPVLLGALDLVRRVSRDFRHQPGLDGLPTPLEGLWRDRMGGREDLTHVMLACLRSVGLPARMVSGYRMADDTGNAYHTWASVFCPVTGWFGLDPRAGACPGPGTVVLNQGRDLSEAGPTDWPPHLVSRELAALEEVDGMPSPPVEQTHDPDLVWDTESAFPWQHERAFELQPPPG